MSGKKTGTDRNPSQQGSGPSWLPHLFLVPFSVATLYPVLYVVKLALSGNDGASASPIPTSISMDAFATVVGNTDSHGNWLFGQQLLNSLVIAGLTTVVGIVLACTAAYGFARFEFPGRRVGLLGFLATQMFPGILTMIPLYVLMQKLGLLDSIAGLTLVYATTSIPFCTWTLKGYFDTLPRELEESAYIDGASRLTIFTRIILPLSAPAIAVTALFSFMSAWNEFVLAYTFLSSEQAFTLPVQIRNYVGDKDVQWSLFAASSLLVSLPVMALFYALEKHLVGGLTAGGVKG
ncbi:MAG: sugar ABC transporter permease [Myxococcales bacterium]|nr:sugar ABC transporter permease [Myxococcales bacterium]